MKLTKDRLKQIIKEELEEMMGSLSADTERAYAGTGPKPRSQDNWQNRPIDQRLRDDYEGIYRFQDERGNFKQFAYRKMGDKLQLFDYESARVGAKTHVGDISLADANKKGAISPFN